MKFSGVVEHLDNTCITVGDINEKTMIYRDPFRAEKLTRGNPQFAYRIRVFALRIEYLNAAVEDIDNIKIPVCINGRHPRKPELTGLFP